MACLALVVWVMSLGAQTPASLRIEVLEGQGAVFQPGALSYKGFTVRVTDATGKPAAGVPVRFTLPSSEPSGQFPNGATSEMQVSDGQGKASVWGIRWGAGTGIVRVAIAAGSGSVTAGMVLPVRIGSGSAPPAPAAAAQELPATPKPATAPPAPPPPVETRAIAITPTPTRVEASFEVPARSVFPAPATPLAAAPEPPAPAGLPTGSALVESRGVIFTRNVGPVERFPSTGGRRKWVVVGLGVAGAIGGGMAYRYLQKPAAAPAASATVTTPPAPALSLSAPVITIAKP
ncbi:MAG: hypothetical protein JNK87_40310 [Bryobacterales bacterium]|nr:hypothetical protein [Bryobacterales bacterium]